VNKCLGLDFSHFTYSSAELIWRCCKGVLRQVLQVSKTTIFIVQMKLCASITESCWRREELFLELPSSFHSSLLLPAPTVLEKNGGVVDEHSKYEVASCKIFQWTLPTACTILLSRNCSRRLFRRHNSHALYFCLARCNARISWQFLIVCIRTCFSEHPVL